ncbi:hypothetical protein N431DRAFT_336998 [Stipitochalara longipes BDJ]|nr:hypothetical protein N431DRAFT_336998 [Stipitochalara longipes BDJ]
MSYPRKRAVTACRLCRVRKRKCNNARPTCKFCETLGAECSYEDPLDHSALVIIERLNEVIQRLDTHIPWTGPGTSSTLPNQSLLHDGFSQNVIGQSFSESPEVSQVHVSHSEHVQGNSVEEFMKIPASRTNADTILLWPIFNGEFLPNHFVDMLFRTEHVVNDDSTVYRSSEAVGIKERSVKDLVENFLAYVHIKNPILDVETLRIHAKRLFEDGPGWDGMSCLVLLACALGALAEPYEQVCDKPSEANSRTLHGTGFAIAESNYYLARRRIGLLGGSIVRSQCYFWSGVYLMYTLRPVEAWQNFLQASSTYHIYLKGQVKGGGFNEKHESKNRLLEQRLYWSCFKSECEIRVELNLPESSIATINYPDMFPSPPNEEDVTSTTDGDLPFIGDAISVRGAGESTEHQQHRTPSFGQIQQRHSWYYYLSEIALRRIFNSVLNSFYTTEQYTGFNTPVQNMVDTATEFLEQLSQWYAGLPSAIRYSEDYSCTPTEELAYMTRGRVLEIRSLIFRPFLYYAVHHPFNDPYRKLVQPFIDDALETARVIIETKKARHRHHGTWFALRSSTAEALCLIAAKRCGNIEMPLGWRHTIQTQIDTLRYWEGESAELPKARELLITMMMESNSE